MTGKTLQKRHLSKRITGLSAFLIGLSVGGMLGWNPDLRAAEVTVSGPETVIFDSDVTGCDNHHLPDSPARAFRNDQGKMSELSQH